MLIYNTLSQKKERLNGRKDLKLFVCGPTVYNLSHIGHARTYITFDAFVRFLKKQKKKIFYLQNITDIDDRIITKAEKENKNPLEFSDFFEKKYLEDMRNLNITSVNKYAKTSKYIPEIIKQIEVLFKKGYAYKTNLGIYFKVKKFKNYGALSRQNLESLRPGWRIEPDKEKTDPLDFALWKFSKKDKINWPSPWGTGRPGWHIEDTAITEKFFGPQYDLHGGGLDLKFPHHEAEIAQQEAASNKKPMVKIWMHTGFLLINGEKMSKSLKNFITIRDFLKKYRPDTLRWIILSSHYRSQLNYTDELAIQAENTLETIKNFLEKLNFIYSKTQTKNKKININDNLKKTEKKFLDALNDDFNTPLAFAAIFDFINGINKNIWLLNKIQAKTLIKFLIREFEILGFLEIKTLKTPSKITKIAAERELSRRNKQFIQADALRKKLTMLGYEIEDTPIGPFLKKRKS